MTFVGIRYRITSGIRIRGVIGIRIEGRRIPVVALRGIIPGDLVLAEAGTTIRRVVIGHVMVNGLDRMEIRVGVMEIGITRRGVA